MLRQSIKTTLIKVSNMPAMVMAVTCPSLLVLKLSALFDTVDHAMDSLHSTVAVLCHRAWDIVRHKFLFLNQFFCTIVNGTAMADLISRAYLPHMYCSLCTFTFLTHCADCLLL